MDKTDRALLRLLQADARASVTSLARELGLARATVQHHMSRLESGGIIAGYTVRLGEEFGRRQIRSHVLIRVEARKNREVANGLRRLPDVRSLYAINGEFDMIAIVTADTTDQIDRTLDAIGEMEGVEKTNSAIVLSTKFQR